MSIINRAKQGALVSLGTFALSALSAYKVSHNFDMTPSAKSVLKVCGTIATVMGVTWAFHPKAVEPPKDTFKKVKASVYPVVTLTMKRVMETDPSRPKPRSTYYGTNPGRDYDDYSDAFRSM